MAYLDWKVGDKVVCVDADPAHFRPDPDLFEIVPDEFGLGLVEGRVYRLSDIYVDPDFKEIMVCVEGVVRSPTEDDLAVGVTNPGFDTRRFRKVQPRKTDIAIFTAMLDPSRQQVDA